MEPTRALEILRSLADGRDPATGEQFPPNSPYQQADNVRALFMALEVLSRRSTESTQSTPRQVDPNRPKAGGPWTPEEEQQLRDAYNARTPISEIAAGHGRTTGAITARLVKLGLIDASAADHPGMPRRSHLAQPDTPRLPSEALAKDGRSANQPPNPTHHGVASERSRVPSNSSTPLTQEERDNLPF